MSPTDWVIALAGAEGLVALALLALVLYRLRAIEREVISNGDNRPENGPQGSGPSSGAPGATPAPESPQIDREGPHDDHE